jgi:hypothetical protein
MKFWERLEHEVEQQPIVEKRAWSTSRETTTVPPRRDLQLPEDIVPKLIRSCADRGRGTVLLDTNYMLRLEPAFEYRKAR